MATSPFSLIALAALLQAGAPDDSLSVVRARLAQDSTDGRAWLAVGRLYLRLADSTLGTPDDTATTRAALDSAELALARSATLLGVAGARLEGDSARVLRVAGWNARTLLLWQARGSDTSPLEWGPLPADLKVPPVLEELGENLLRACPAGGVLLTAQDADAPAAWYMRFVRGLRPDLLIVSLAAWRSAPALAARLARDLKLGGRGEGDGWVPELVKRRPVCVTMAFDRPPEARARVKWVAWPLVWVAGPVKGDRVPARDFVFAALRVALDERDPWAQPALTLYTRAARATPALCEALATFKLTGEIPSCRR